MGFDVKISDFGQKNHTNGVRVQSFSIGLQAQKMSNYKICSSFVFGIKIYFNIKVITAQIMFEPALHQNRYQIEIINLSERLYFNIKLQHR